MGIRCLGQSAILSAISLLCNLCKYHQCLLRLGNFEWKVISLLSASNPVPRTVQTVLAAPQSVKHRITKWLTNSTPGSLPKRTDRYSNKHLHKFTAALFMKAKRWKQPECSPADERIHQIWSSHIIEYCSAIKQNEVHAIPWVSLDNITLGESEEHERSHVIWFHWYELSQNSQIHTGKMESRSVIVRIGTGRGKVHKGSPSILEWVAYTFSSGSSWPRNQTGVSYIAGGFFTN